MVLYLHGSGERGDDNVRQLAVGLPPALLHYPERYGCVVVIPQCPLDQEWYGEAETAAIAALDTSVREFRGDPRRLYLTGISMGGAGVWYMARHPDRFAAIVPVCGEVVRQPGDPFPIPPPPDLSAILHSPDPYAALAQAIGRTPVWAFHGTDDPIIPVTQSRRMVAALESKEGRARYTEVEGAGHNVWDHAYADPHLPPWILDQRKEPVRRKRLPPAVHWPQVRQAPR